MTKASKTLKKEKKKSKSFVRNSPKTNTRIEGMCRGVQAMAETQGQIIAVLRSVVSFHPLPHPLD